MRTLLSLFCVVLVSCIGPGTRQHVSCDFQFDNTAGVPAIHLDYLFTTLATRGYYRVPNSATPALMGETRIQDKRIQIQPGHNSPNDILETVVTIMVWKPGISTPELVGRGSEEYDPSSGGHFPTRAERLERAATFAGNSIRDGLAYGGGPQYCETKP